MKSRHITLARKYRPQTLSDILGQEVLVQTLRNAISLNRLPQAILLTGGHGTGKTTTARIIAKQLNCTSIPNQGEDCCCNCDSCVSIAECSHPDVLEFDAASNTSVNDIRDIIETIKYVPIKSKYKFYIIDEAHMLSNSAFNALLKTLEEPPSRVVFILATTEVHKVPLTIVSRCLQLRLKPIKQQAIEDCCNQTLKKEGYSADAAVSDMISRAANGSMRDALSILEGAIAFCSDQKKHLSSEKTGEMLGYNKQGDMADIFHSLCAGDINTCLQKVRLLYDIGADPSMIVREMLNFIHEMTINQIKSSISKIQTEFLLVSWNTMSELLSEMKTSENHMVLLEMALVKLAHLRFDETSDHNPSSLSEAKDSSKERPEVMSMLLSKTNEELPSVQKIRLLNPSSRFFEMKSKIETYNHLRILLAFLLDIGETILYHRLSAVIKIVRLNIATQTIVVNLKGNSSLVKQIEADINRVTNTKWRLHTDNESAGMTYTQFLDLLDNQHEKALLQTDIVKYILSKFDDLKVDTIKLNNNYIN